MIRKLGSESRIVRGDNGYIDWELVFSQSLLGIKAPPFYKVDDKVLTPKERKLLEENNFGIASIVDFDGILVSPSHNWRKSGEIGVKTLLGFKELLQASDSVLIRTSRFFLPDGLLEKGSVIQRLTRIFRQGVYRFPFIDPTLPLEFNKEAGNKLAIIHKPLLGKDENYFNSLKILCSFENVIVYCFISSEGDRRESIKFLERFPNLASSIVFFDTAHYGL